MNKQVKSKIFHCNFFPKYRSGTDKVLSIYWFVILFIVAGGVVYMVAVFYGTPYDVREIEANLLINKVADCVATGGNLNYDVGGNLNKDNLLGECKITFNVEDTKGWKNNQHFVNVSVYGFENDKGIKDTIEGTPISVGNPNLLDGCEDKVGTHFAFCIERGFYVSEGKVIKIFVAVKKVDKNV